MRKSKILKIVCRTNGTHISYNKKYTKDMTSVQVLELFIDYLKAVIELMDDSGEFN